MQRLTIAMLLSLAPVIINAETCTDTRGCCGERSTECQTTDNSVQCLKKFDNDVAHKANIAYVSVTGSITPEIAQYLEEVFRRPADFKTDNAITYIFTREDLDSCAWFECLAEVERAYNDVISNMNLMSATVDIDLGLNRLDA